MRNPLTKEAFAEFCESKPADKTYDIIDANSCAVAQFLKANGVQNFSLYSWEVPEAYRTAFDRPWTFGALATRLRS